MSISSYEVARAIYAGLSTYDPLTSLLHPSPIGGPGVYDAVPEGAQYPYVKIGGGDVENNRPTTFGAPGREQDISIHIWSRYRGMSEVYQIAKEIADRLAPSDPKQSFPLYLEPWTWTQTLFLDFTALEDPDGVSRHGILRFRVRSHRPAA